MDIFRNNFDSLSILRQGLILHHRDKLREIDTTSVCDVGDGNVLRDDVHGSDGYDDVG